MPNLTFNLHGLPLTFTSPDPALQARFELVYGHLPPHPHPNEGLSITWQHHPAEMAPPPPSQFAPLSEEPLVSYYQQGDTIAVRLPKYGLITVDLARQQLHGQVTDRCLSVYGAFEDVMMISLAPLYRRRGWYPLHAFAGLAPGGQAVLITGNMGSGKTTTGLALLVAGWKLLSNDSPLLSMQETQVVALAYPGQLSAFDDSLDFFTLPALHALRQQPLPAEGRAKRVFQAQAVFPEPWADSGLVGAIYLPQVIPGLEKSEIVPVPPPQAVLELLPQAIEGWDKAAIAQNLTLIRHLVEQAPCYHLRLAPDVNRLPELLQQGIR